MNMIINALAFAVALYSLFVIAFATIERTRIMLLKEIMLDRNCTKTEAEKNVNKALFKFTFMFIISFSALVINVFFK